MKTTYWLNSWNIVKTAVFGILISVCFIFVINNFNEATLRTTIWLTARISGLLFGMAFASAALATINKSVFSEWLLKNRKYFGISFALVRLIHLSLIITLELVFRSVVPSVKIINVFGGGIAYTFTVAMLLTSFPFFASYLSRKQWKLLHTIGSYWIWSIFLVSYLKRIDSPVRILFAIFFVALFLFRLLAHYSKKLII